MLKKKENRIKRHKRVRAKIIGTSKIPRLCVFRSNKYISAQLINDEKGKTLLVVKDLKSAAAKVGRTIAEKAIEKKFRKAVFDRGGYKYHGKVKLLADAARKAGLKI